MLCENWVKTKLHYTSYTRKFWFSVNMPSHKGYKYWTQIRAINTERSYLQQWNFAKMCHIHISWKPTSFKCEKILVSPDWEFFCLKIGDIGGNLNFFFWGVQILKFLKSNCFNIFLLSKGVLCQILSWNEANLLIS